MDALDTVSREQVEGLVAEGLIHPAGDLRPDGSEETWSYWEPHDLYFHWRTRGGEAPYPSGKTLRFAGEHGDSTVTPPLPVVRPVPEGPYVPLAVGADELLPMQREFGEVLSNRVTRRFASGPLTIKQLTAFLHAHRIRAKSEPSAMPGNENGASVRPYPSGGATYEIEALVVTRGIDGGRNDGIGGGVWWFDPLREGLVRECDDAGLVDSVLGSAFASTGGMASQGTLILYAARMGRVSWAYSGIAYRLALLHAGVLIEERMGWDRNLITPIAEVLLVGTA